MTDRFILARPARALIDIHLTVCAVKTRTAFTGVHGDEILARGFILAGVGLALINLHFTVHS